MSDFTGFVLAFVLGVACGYFLRLWIESREMDRLRLKILGDLCQREKEQGTYKRRIGRKKRLNRL